MHPTNYYYFTICQPHRRECSILDNFHKERNEEKQKEKKKKTATNKLIIECSNYACRTASRSLRSYYIVRLIELLSWQNCRFGVTLSSFSLSSPAFEFGLLLFSLVAFAGCYRIVIHTAVICLTPSIIYFADRNQTN